MPYKWASVSMGTLLGNLEEFRLPGLLREKKSIFGLLSWTRRSLRFWIWGSSGALVKEQGSPDTRLWGTKGPSIRPRCIGTVRARTHC